jgi:hypothetical protein
MGGARGGEPLRVHAQYTILKDGAQRCNLCTGGTITSYTKGTSVTNLRRHLLVRHPEQAASLRLHGSKDTSPAAIVVSEDDHDGIEEVKSASNQPGKAVSNKRNGEGEVVTSATNESKRQRIHGQQLMSNLWQAAEPAKGKTIYPTLAKLLAVHSLPHRLLESELFLELLTLYRQTGELPPSRRGVIHHLTMVEQDTRQQVVRKLRQAGAVTIALDGWTNIRQEKVTNIVPIASGVSYYWESIVNRMEANTADWQRPLIKKAVESVIGCGVPVVAMVTDNEAVNGSLYRLLLPDFPFLVHVPCAAHTIQLCVNKMLELPEVRSIMSEMRRLLRFFKKHKSARNQLKQIQSTLRAGMAVLALNRVHHFFV